MRKQVRVSFAGTADVLQHIIPLRKLKSASKAKSSSKKLYSSHTVTVSDSEDNHAPEDGMKQTAVSKELTANKNDIVGKDVFGFKAEGPVVHTLKRDDDDDDENDEDDGESSSDNGSSDEDLSATFMKRKSRRTPKLNSQKTKKKRTPSKSPADGLQRYFENQSSVSTSDHTLSRLRNSRMNYSQMSAALQSVDFMYPHEQEALKVDYRRLYDKWMFQICGHSFNLLLHGVGSKRQVIDNFISATVADYPHIVVNGYFPALTIKSILSSITDDVLKFTGCFPTPVEHCEFIRKHFESNHSLELFIIVHNIDGVALRSRKVQMALSLLACIRGIHIIASIDHINAHILWDQTMLSRFNWIVYDVTTYDYYTNETSYENSLLVQQTGALQLSSLVHVMHSLTQNARGIFLILARHHLDNRDNSSYNGLSFPEFYQKCREAFLVNSDLTLQTQLTEFRDHKLLRLRKGVDGIEYLKIPLETATLAEFVEQYEENE